MECNDEEAPVGSSNSYNILLEDGFALLEENGDNLVLESYVPSGQGGPGKKREEDTTELWEVGGRMSRINGNILSGELNRIKYSIEESSPTITVKENFLESPPTSPLRVNIRNVKWN